jgi:pantoate--beta-alanine ligase
MKLIHTPKDIRDASRQWRAAGRRVALVPTMGFLHEGHLSLIRLASEQADAVVVSIFVNPAQFGPNEDFAQYPRDLTADLRLCERAGVDAVFQPEAAQIYAADHSTWVVEEKLSQPLCGESRPGHFRGVATVVAKLFNEVEPDIAVFGHKDAQQVLVIQRMVRDLDFPIDIITAPTVREADGLAMSSRNTYLTADERRRAISIHRGLNRAKAAFAGGERNAAVLRQVLVCELEQAAARIDYVECVSRNSLQPLMLVDQPALLAVAAFFGGTRLIDNVYLDI